MRPSFLRAVLGASLSLVAVASFADEAPLVDLAAAAKTRATVAQGIGSSHALTAASATLNGSAAGKDAAPTRAYPPSCLNSPLPLGLWANDPNPLHTTIVLPGDPTSGDATERAYTETVDLYAFRVACAGGKSATLLEI